MKKWLFVENFCELIKHTMIEMHQYLYQFMLNRKDSFAIVICLSSIIVNTYHLNFEIHNHILILRTTVHLYQKFKYNSLNSWLKFALIEINICCPLLFLKCTRNHKWLPDVEFKRSTFCFRFWILSLQAEDCRSPALRYFCVSSTISTYSNYKSFKNSLCCT